MANIDFTDNSKVFLKELEDKLPKILEMLGQAGENNAKLEITALGAVDTGNLRNSLSHTDNGEDTAYIGTNVEYAPYVEMGTSRGMKARPYLQNAIQNHKDDYEQIIRNELSS